MPQGLLSAMIIPMENHESVSPQGSQNAGEMTQDNAGRILGQLEEIRDSVKIFRRTFLDICQCPEATDEDILSARKGYVEVCTGYRDAVRKVSDVKAFDLRVKKSRTLQSRMEKLKL